MLDVDGRVIRSDSVVIWEYTLVIVWDFFFDFLLICGIYCELDLNVGENSIL